MLELLLNLLLGPAITKYLIHDALRMAIKLSIPLVVIIIFHYFFPEISMTTLLEIWRNTN